MGNLIQVTTFTNPAKAETGLADSAAPTAAKTLVISTSRIIAVQTRPTAYRTTGITDVTYNYPINEATLQVTLVCTETQAAILALGNAPLA